MKERAKYIFSEGELKRKDDSLCFRKDGKNIYLPVEGIRELYLMGNVTFNNKLIDFLSRYGIVLHVFNYYGYYSGTFYPKERYISGRLTVQQARTFDCKRLEIARSFVKGTADNMNDFLSYYYKQNKVDELKEVIRYLKTDTPRLLLKTQNIKQILAVEGAAWHRFYQSLQFFLNESFIFNKRVKQPPDNPVNAMISFGNMILYTKVMTQLYHTHLDQSISFLHEPMERRFSLSLDIAEAYKPIIVFKTMTTLINRKQIKVEKHFDRRVNYCVLNEVGRKIFIEAIEEQLNSVFMHSKLNRKVSYLHSIKLEGYKLTKTIIEDKAFEPFSTKRLR